MWTHVATSDAVHGTTTSAFPEILSPSPPRRGHIPAHATCTTSDAGLLPAGAPLLPGKCPLGAKVRLQAGSPHFAASATPSTDAHCPQQPTVCRRARSVRRLTLRAP